MAAGGETPKVVELKPYEVSDWTDTESYAFFSFAKKDAWTELSNLYPSPVRVKFERGGEIVASLVFPTLEHAFQAVKILKVLATRDAACGAEVLATEARRIAALPRSTDAKAAGGKRSFSMTTPELSAWDERSPSVMLCLMVAKFAPGNGAARMTLEATGDLKLVERVGRLAPGALWGTNSSAKGFNLTGILLEMVRDEYWQRAPTDAYVRVVLDSDGRDGTFASVRGGPL